MNASLKNFQDDLVRGGMPSAITLRMSSEELETTECARIQNRTIKSVRFGELNVDYETGTTADGRRMNPEELNLAVAPGMTFAYDTIVFVTLLRYVHLMRREEIQSKILSDHYFKISTGSISELSLMGLAYLERCHFANAEKLSKIYGEACFILHLDGTNEGGMYNHFVVRDGIRGNVLYAEKIVSESEGLPFDLPALAFHNRCEKAFSVIEEIFSETTKKIPREFCSTMMFVRNRLQKYFSYSHINQLKNINDIFLELRDILHPSDKTEKTPLNWGMLDAGIQVENIAEKLENLRTRAEKKTKTKLSPYLIKAWKTVLSRLRKYEGKFRNPYLNSF